MLSKQPVLSVSDHHADDTPSTSDSLVKSQKGKVMYLCFLCKDMHRTYLCPRMDESSKLLEDLTVPQQKIPISYHKLSLDIPLVDPSPSLVDPTLPLKSEFKEVDPIPSLVDPTLPLKSEVQVVDPSPSLVDPTLPLKSEVKVVDPVLTSIDPTLPLESEFKWLS